MVDIATFFADDARVQVYRQGECDGEGSCVLYWMQRSQRGRENAALNAATALANVLNLPVVVAFVIVDYPAANLRHYVFMLEGIAGVAHELRKRGTPLVLRLGDPPDEILRLTRELHAAVLVSDEAEMRTPRSWRDEVKEHIAVPFACVDADVVPTKFFPKEEWAARTLRPKIHRLLPTYLQPVIDLEPLRKLACPPCDSSQTDDPLSYLATLQLDRSVSPSTSFHGGQDEGMRLLQRFLQERLTSYGTVRNLPERAGTSELSAYLHFGQISVQQVAWQVEQYVRALPDDAREAVEPESRAFLEELIVRRELAINFALRNPDYDSLKGCPN